MVCDFQPIMEIRTALIHTNRQWGKQNDVDHRLPR
jgi:hypothetical protein